MGNMQHSELFKAIRGAGGGGGSQQQRTPMEAPDSLRSISYARILDLVSEGEIFGLADPVTPGTCVFFNETPAQNADGTYNFSNFHVETRVGTQTQDFIRGFDATENEIAVGVELTAPTPWTHAITNLALTAFRIRLSTPSMANQNPTNGDVTGTTVVYKIELSTDGGAFVEVFYNRFSGKTTSKYERSHRIELPAATTGWTVRVTRVTPDSTSGTLNNKTFVESYTDIIDAKLRYPMSALVATIIDSEQFNSIPSRTFRMKGRIIRVPTNYDPETRTYTGIWDGTFQSAYCNNPAWVFYDMVTNTRYGLGHLVSDALIDKWTLYKIGQYCDEMVDDGFGGTEPRFTANLYLQSQNDALRVLQDMATMFRGIMYSAGGAIMAAADMPDDPIYTFAPANVIDGKFVYSGSSRKVRHTVALVSWNDMSDFGRAKIEYIEDLDGIARYGVQQTEIIAIGCTSRGQARRFGKYLLTTERYETDTVAFGVGLDGTIPAPGKIINIADPLRAGRRMGGRIKAATINSITVDALPSIAPVAGDTFTAALPDGTIEQRVVQSVVGGVITATANFSQVPQPQGVWLVEASDLQAQRFRVLGVTEKNDGVGFNITAVQHVEGKFAYVEQDIAIEEPPTGGIGNIVFTPQNIDMTFRHVPGPNSTQTIATISWDAVAGAVLYNLQYRMLDGNWIDAGNTSSVIMEIVNPPPGAFEVLVCAINAMGKKSQPAHGGPYDITPNDQPPEFLEAVNASIANALQTAENAQATADGEIVLFDQPGAPVIGAGAGEAKVGDIWVDNDDGDAIYRCRNGAWEPAPNDAIALAILDAARAQATADGKVKLFVGPTAPVSGYSLNDLWFNTDIRVTFRWNGADWTDNVSDVTLAQLGGNGVNILWDEYTQFDTAIASLTTTTAPAFYKSADGIALATVADAAGISGNVLRATTGGASATGDYAFFSSFSTAYNMVLQGGAKYLVSFRGKASVNGHSIQPQLSTNAGLATNGDIALSTSYARYWTIIDLAALPTATKGSLVILFNRSAVAGRQVFIDQVMVEPMVGTKAVPSAWTHGSQVNAIVAVENSAANAQATADAAATDAATSLNQLDAIASDSILTPNEKIKAKQEYNEIKNEQAGIDSQATTYGITTAKANYDNAITALKTYLKDTVGVLDAAFNWTGLTGNTNIVSATWDQKWLDVYLNRQTLLNTIAQLIGGQAQNGVFPPTSFGDELVPNGNFEAVAAGGGALSATPGAIMADGWEIASSNGAPIPTTGLTTTALGQQGSRAVIMAIQAGTLAANTAAYTECGMKQKFAVQPGENFILKFRMREDWSANFPAGINTQMIVVGLTFYDGNGAWLGRFGSSFVPHSSGAQGAFKDFQSSIVAPANAVTAHATYMLYVANNTGAPIAIPANCSYVYLDSVSVKRINVVGTGANMLDNSEWTRSITSWGNIAAASITKVQDSYRPQNALASGVTWFPYQDVAYSLFAGQPYSASVELGWGGTIDANAWYNFGLEFYNASNVALGTAYTGQTSIGAGAQGNAVRLQINGAIMPVNTAYVRFIIGAQGAGTFYFRKPKLERGYVATAYTPGSDAGYGTELTYAGSGRQIGDLRNLNPASPANLGSAWISGTLTYSASAGTPATATISMSAGTLRIAGVDIAYNAASVGVTGTGGTTVTYLVYFDDPTYAGGTRTLGATTSYDTLLNSTGRVYVGKINVTFPTSGSGSGGGTKPCVVVESKLPCGRIADEIDASDLLHIHDPKSGEESFGIVSYAATDFAPCVKLTFENGVKLSCSIYAPIFTRERGYQCAPFVEGLTGVTRAKGVIADSKITRVEQIGYRAVRRLTVEDMDFWAGEEDDMYALHHNIKYDTP